MVLGRPFYYRVLIMTQMRVTARGLLPVSYLTPPICEDHLPHSPQRELLRRIPPPHQKKGGGAWNSTNCHWHTVFGVFKGKPKHLILGLFLNTAVARDFSPSTTRSRPSTPNRRRPPSLRKWAWASLFSLLCFRSKHEISPIPTAQSIDSMTTNLAVVSVPSAPAREQRLNRGAFWGANELGACVFFLLPLPPRRLVEAAGDGAAKFGGLDLAASGGGAQGADPPRGAKRSSATRGPRGWFESSGLFGTAKAKGLETKMGDF